MTADTLPSGREKTARVRAMFDTIAPRYEFVNRLLTLGMDRRWRRRAVRDLKLPSPSVVLDVAAGTGDFARELVLQGHEVLATDLSFNMLAVGGFRGARVQSDAAQLTFRSASFDGVTSGYALRNFTDLPAVFREMARVLRPGGRLSLLEVAEPTRGLWRAGFRLWFRHVVPFIGGVLSDRAAYRYLPASTAYLPTADEIRLLLNDAGFSAVNHRLILGGLSQQFIATRAS